MIPLHKKGKRENTSEDKSRFFYISICFSPHIITQFRRSRHRYTSTHIRTFAVTHIRTFSVTFTHINLQSLVLRHCLGYGDDASFNAVASLVEATRSTHDMLRNCRLTLLCAARGFNSGTVGGEELTNCGFTRSAHCREYKRENCTFGAV